MAIHINPAHRGRFARDVGKKPGEPITGADIKKGLNSSSAAERKRANFAKVARTWKHGTKKKSRAENMYGGHEAKSFAAKKSPSPALPKRKSA
jgi:hypothetical protein